MTNEEAIEIIKFTPLLRYEELTNTESDLGNALRMAIEALERQPYLIEDGTLHVYVASGYGVRRVFVSGDDHWGGLYYLDED